MQAAVERRQEDQEHGAGSTGRMARRERTEVIRRNAVGDELFLERRAGLPPVGEIGVVARGIDQTHTGAAPGNLDDVDQQHDADTDHDHRADKTKDRLGLALARQEQQRSRHERVDKRRHEQRDRHGQGRHIVRRLMDRQDDPAGHQHSSRREEQRVPAFAQPLPVEQQQNARARHREESRQLAERSEKLAEAALPAGIEKFGDRQIPDGTHDHQKQQHRADHAAAAEIGLF